jgi:hypothetical protein
MVRAAGSMMLRRAGSADTVTIRPVTRAFSASTTRWSRTHGRLQRERVTGSAGETSASVAKARVSTTPYPPACSRSTVRVIRTLSSTATRPDAGSTVTAGPAAADQVRGPVPGLNSTTLVVSSVA